MNPEQWNNQVKELLDKSRPVDGGRYCLVVIDKQLVLVKKKDLEIHNHPLATFSSRDVNKGLSSSRWYSTGCKLAAQKDLNPELTSSNSKVGRKT